MKQYTSDLGHLFFKYGTDKTRFQGIYHALFKHLRYKLLNILEIGIGTIIPEASSSMQGYGQPWYQPGGSLRAWRDYFPNAMVFGIDIQPDTQFKNEKRIITSLCDSTEPKEVRTFFQNQENIFFNLNFDIIIDDGSHVDIDQLSTLENFYPHLRNGGSYIIEDIDKTRSRLLTQWVDQIERICQRAIIFIFNESEESQVLIISRLLAEEHLHESIINDDLKGTY